MNENERYRPRPLKRLRTRPDGSIEQVPVDPETIRQLSRRSAAPLPPRKAERYEKVALRCWVEPDGWKPLASRCPPVVWKRSFLVLRTLGASGEAGPLYIGLGIHRTAERVLQAWLFHREGIPASDLEALGQAAASLGLPAPIPLGDARGGFLAEFRRLAWKRRVPVVGHGLASDLARLAADWRPGKAGTFFEGGFVMVLGTKDPPPGRRPRWKGKDRRLRNGRVEDGDFPTLGLKAIEGRRAFMSLLMPGRPDARDLIPEGGEGKPDHGCPFRGYLVDLIRAVHAFTGETTTLPTACRTFGVEPPPERPGPDASLEVRVRHLVAEAEAVARLYVSVLSLHQQVAGDRLRIDEVVSAASYAPALFRAIGLRPPLARWPKFPRHVLGWSFSALYAGRAELGVRRIPGVPVSVVPVDFTGLYPVMAAHVGAWDFLSAEGIEVREEDPIALAAWVAGLTVEDLLDPTTIRLMNVLVRVTPGEDVLPKRIRSGKVWVTSVGPLTSAIPLWYCLADVVVSFLATGRVPRFDRVARLEPVGRVGGLTALDLPGIGAFDPEAQDGDLFRFLAVGRAGLKAEAHRYPWPTRQGLLASLYKTLDNAACSGLLMQTNRTEPRKEGWKAVVWGPEAEGPAGGFVPSPRPKRIDEPGTWCFPPVAAFVLAAGRLVEALVYRLFEDEGGYVAYGDTDSAFPVAGEAPIPCPGGPVRTEDGYEALPALDHRTIVRVEERLEQLSPYPDELRPWALEWDEPSDVEMVDAVEDPFRFVPELRLKPQSYPVRIELPYFLRPTEENQDGGPSWPRQPHLFGVRTKAYALYFLDRPGPPMRPYPGAEVVWPTQAHVQALTKVKVVKASGHALGHLADPGDLGSDDTSWICDDYAYLIARHLELGTAKEPEFSGEPALTVGIVNAPSLLPPGAGRGPLTWAWPFARVLQAYLPNRGLLDEPERAVVPIAPFTPGAGVPSRWWSRPSGKRLPGIVTVSRAGGTALFGGGPVVVEDHRSIREGLVLGADLKAMTPDGIAPRPGTAGRIIPRRIEAYDLVLIGKETAYTAGQPAGAVSDPVEHYTVYDDPKQDRAADAARQVLRDYRLRAGPEARRLGVPKSTFHAVVGGRPMSTATKEILLPLAARFAREGLQFDQPGRLTPEGDERAVYAYLKDCGRIDQRMCWRCGRLLTGRQTKWCSKACMTAHAQPKQQLWSSSWRP